jgi:hypothetical protein
MRDPVTRFLAVLLVCIATASCGAAGNGDEFAWRALVAITETRASATTPGESAAGWRFWLTRSELFPEPGPHPNIPTQVVADRYRPLDFIHQQSLVSAAKDLETRGYHLFGARLDSDSAPPLEMISLNPHVASVVLKHKMYWREGMIRYISRESHGKFRLPVGAREIKTEWVKLTDSDNPDDYIVGARDNVRYGLVALHLQSHELPNSLWATWIHEKYLPALGDYPRSDSFGGTDAGFPSAALSQLVTRASQRIWLKYRLVGTQVSFTERANLGNPLIEGRVFPNLRDSSCITCHKQAAIQDNGYWSFAKLAPGQAFDLPRQLAPLDFDFTLTIAPRCKNGTGSECTELVK